MGFLFNLREHTVTGRENAPQFSQVLLENVSGSYKWWTSLRNLLLTTKICICIDRSKQNFYIPFKFKSFGVTFGKAKSSYHKALCVHFLKICVVWIWVLIFHISSQSKTMSCHSVDYTTKVIVNINNFNFQKFLQST